MTENVLQELMIENFRAIRSDIRPLRDDISDVKSSSLAGICQHLSGFMTTDAAHESAIATIHARLNHIERRLEIGS